MGAGKGWTIISDVGITSIWRQGINRVLFPVEVAGDLPEKDLRSGVIRSSCQTYIKHRAPKGATHLFCTRSAKTPVWRFVHKWQFRASLFGLIKPQLNPLLRHCSPFQAREWKMRAREWVAFLARLMYWSQGRSEFLKTYHMLIFHRLLFWLCSSQK
jgi:hypothetical protein